LWELKEENMDIEKSMMSMMMMVVMIGVMMAILPQPAEAEQPPEPMGFGCPYCASSFDSMSELITHISEAHPEMPPYEEVDMEWE